MIEVILFSVFGVGLAACAWGLYCNNCTYRDRTLIANKAVFGRPDWRQRNEDYSRVSYDEHFRALFCFRNPWRLYSNRIRSAVGK